MLFVGVLHEDTPADEDYTCLAISKLICLLQISVSNFLVKGKMMIFTFSILIKKNLSGRDRTCLIGLVKHAKLLALGWHF